MYEDQFAGDIPNIVNNKDKIYAGQLRYYLTVVFGAPNIYHGYHGLRHMLHVMWVCYQACIYYSKLGTTDGRRWRNLLIAALFHDFGHTGKQGDDAVNIEIAIDALRQYILPEDEEFLDEIIAILKATQFPHADLGSSMTLEQSIIRDADLSQAFGVAWIGEIAAGFGAELGKTPRQMLEQQLRFLNGLKFYSDFGKVFYGESAVKAKTAETAALLDILE